MKSIFVMATVLLMTVLFTSCEQDEMVQLEPNDLKSAQIFGDTATHVFTTSVDDLTETEIAGLMLMREEEKMARDVYDFFFDTYGLLVFDRISTSEERHMGSVLALIEYFGLTDPTTTESGVFNNVAIQSLYNELIAAGSNTETALSTGAFIEEYDIVDLQKLLTETQNADLLLVYNNLKKGSENHLKAFTSNLLAYNVTYEPQILSAEVYAEILASTNTKGNGNGNKGTKGKKGSGVGTGTPIDANGDGICDTTGEPINSNQGSTSQNNNNGNGNKGKGGKR